MSLAPAHAAFLRSGQPQRGVLRCDDFTPLALEGCVIDVQVTWFLARVNVRQEFKNTSGASIKAFAALPVEPGWTVAGFRFEIENHFAMGKLVHNDVADPVATTKDPVLDLFTAAIPRSIQAGQSVIVTATYFAPIAAVGSHAATLRLPRNLSAGRDPSADETTAWRSAFVVPSMSRLTRSVMVSIKGRMYAANDAPPKVPAFPDAASKLLGDPRNFEIKFESRDPSLQLHQDVVVNFSLIKDEDPINVQIVQEIGKDFAAHDAFALAVSVAPEFTATHRANPNVEVVFAVDCSGSMDAHMAAVKQALRVATSGLPTSCFVNIVRFGDTTEWLFPEGSRQVDAATLAEVHDFIAGRLDANLGETKINRAVNDILAKPFLAGFARNVVLLSDGTEAAHSQRLLELVKANTHSTRVSTVAIGPTADTRLFAEIATQSNGRAVVAPTTINAALLVNLLAQVVVPTLADVALVYSYDGSDAEPPIRKSHDRIALIPADERRVLYGIAAADLRSFSAVVGGNIALEHTEYRVHSGDLTRVAEKSDAHAGDAHGVSLVHVAAASERIRTVIDRSERSCATAEEAEEVTRLSLQFGVITPYTTFQGNDGHGTAVDPDRRMIAAAYASERARLRLPPGPVTKDISGAAIHPDSGYVPKIVAHSTREFMGAIVADVVNALCAEPTAEEILLLQNVDGSWSPSVKAAGATGRSLREIETADAAHDNLQAWMTALVVAALSARYSLDRDATQLAIAKANAHLVAIGAAQLSPAAAAFLR